jgi:hypothetical protein
MCAEFGGDVIVVRDSNMRSKIGRWRGEEDMEKRGSR